MSPPSLKTRLHQATQDIGSPFQVIEKDYALSYILAGMASHKQLAHSLIFKGGTALKKLYFGDYRFSEDLDFSTINAPKNDELEQILIESMKVTEQLLQEQGPFKVTIARYTERNPHPCGQEAFTVHVQFPWHPHPLCRIKLEITHDEPVIFPAVTRKLMHGYDEPLTIDIVTYSLDEIVAEKLRTLLQTNIKLQTRGWNRPRARDYYDLWRILSTFHSELNHTRIRQCLKAKCAVRDISYNGLDDFFTQLLVTEAYRTWESNLGTFVRNLPSCDQVLFELRTLMTEIIPTIEDSVP